MSTCYDRTGLTPDQAASEVIRLRRILRTIANQCGPFGDKDKPQLDYATIGNLARFALVEGIA